MDCGSHAPKVTNSLTIRTCRAQNLVVQIDLRDRFLLSNSVIYPRIAHFPPSLESAILRETNLRHFLFLEKFLLDFLG